MKAAGAASFSRPEPEKNHWYDDPMGPRAVYQWRPKFKRNSSVGPTGCFHKKRIKGERKAMRILIIGGTGIISTGITRLLIARGEM